MADDAVGTEAGEADGVDAAVVPPAKAKRPWYSFQLLPGERGLVTWSWSVVIGLGLALATWTLRIGEATVLGWMLSAGLHLLLLAAALPLIVAAVHRRRALAVCSALLVLAQVVVMWPLLGGGGEPDDVEGRPTLEISALNVYVDNDELGDMAGDALDTDRDVVAFTELTPKAEVELLADGIAERYPYRVGESNGGTVGAVIFSSYPIELAEESNVEVLSADVRVPGPDDDDPIWVRIFLIHSFPPGLSDQSGWRRSIRSLDRRLDDAPEPWIAIGDYNGTYDHRLYRDLLGDGRQDAHVATGRGLAASWPTTGPFLPPVFLIDRAITSRGVEPVRTNERRVAGSDHTMLDVDIAL